MERWIADWQPRQLLLCLLTIIIGGASYGAVMGAWRGELQAYYVAVKFPLLILLTTLGSGLFNGMMAPLLGLNISFRQSLLAILMSFAISSAILGSLSPLMAFIVWNTPEVSTGARGFLSHSFILLSHVAAIGFAGMASNFRLRQLLEQLSGSRRTANKILFAWLAGNLFLGSQLSWILRPFIGSPGLTMEFLRPDAFYGNFYEAVFFALKQITTL
jgi:hypothetical protein